MPPPDPERLFEQAAFLLLKGDGNQDDLRKAVATAYYALFHAVLTAAADHVVGKDRRDSKIYELAYRSIDHKALRVLCSGVANGDLPAAYAPYVPEGGFGEQITNFATVLVPLQKKRHEADYSPSLTLAAASVAILLKEARQALDDFNAAPEEQRQAFAALALFKPRGGEGGAGFPSLPAPNSIA